MAAAQPTSGLARDVESIQASRVMPVVRWSEGASLTITTAVDPLNVRASPDLPEVVQVGPERVPLHPPCTRLFHSLADQIICCPLRHPGGDRPACVQPMGIVHLDFPTDGERPEKSVSST
jgi:hypothetical protein